MKKQRALVVVILLLLGSALFFVNRARQTRAQLATPAKSAGSATRAVAPSSASSAGSSAAATGASDTAGAPASAVELRSLRQMTQLLAAAVRPNAREADLLKALTDSKQQPQVVGDNNPITGDMDIIRTQNPPPGTRYFHAQYFGGEKKEKFAQHLSFEFKPGPQALQQAIAAVQSSFGVGAPEKTRDDFFEWKLSDGYCAWVSPLGEKDMEHHPFNAYTPEDKGTIRVAVEVCEQEE